MKGKVPPSSDLATSLKFIENKPNLHRHITTIRANALKGMGDYRGVLPICTSPVLTKVKLFVASPMPDIVKVLAEAKCPLRYLFYA